MSNWSVFVREHMDRLGLDNAELSRRANVSPATVSRWFTEDAQPSVKIIRSTAEVLGVPILKAMIAAEALTDADLGDTRFAPDPDQLTDDELVSQLEKRLRMTAGATAATSPLPPPPPVPHGWYPDPAGLPIQRYWDGAWTEHTAPVGAPVAPSH